AAAAAGAAGGGGGARARAAPGTAGPPMAARRALLPVGGRRADLEPAGEPALWCEPSTAAPEGPGVGAGVTASGGGIWPGPVRAQVLGWVTSDGGGRAGGSAKAGAAARSTMSRRLSALASRHVIAPRFHLVSTSRRIDVWSCTT